jgi:pyruvate dehydrogenase E1 component
VATPSGITLAPEGGAHQSISSPLIGMAQDGIASFEPAFVDELAVILQWAFEYVQRSPSTAQADDWLREHDGGSVYLRLSTRPLEQPVREIAAAVRDDIIKGGYWLKAPAEGAELAIAYQGAVAEEAAAPWASCSSACPAPASSPSPRPTASMPAGRPPRPPSSTAAGSCRMSSVCSPPSPARARLVTVIDGHPATLSWLGSVHGHRVQALGVEHFGQTGTIADLYARYRLDVDAIIEAALSPVPR